MSDVERHERKTLTKGRCGNESVHHPEPVREVQRWVVSQGALKGLRRRPHDVESTQESLDSLPFHPIQATEGEFQSCEAADRGHGWQGRKPCLGCWVLANEVNRNIGVQNHGLSVARVSACRRSTRANSAVSGRSPKSPSTPCRFQ